MRMTRLFSQTLREAPADAQVPSHVLLLRAGYIRQLASGIFSYLPLAHRALSRIEEIIRQEMDAIGGQEIKMPVVHAADVWKESGRYEEYDESLTRFHDRHGRDMVLATTHEEIVADLASREIRSYRQLPCHGLPLPDQVARRGAAHLRPAAGARVHHEGLLLPRRRAGGAGGHSTGPTTRPTSTSSAVAGCRCGRCAPTWA